jgi:AcrR family transcriptional regulator
MYPLSATTYYFASKERLLEQALLLAAREETERLERLELEIAPLSLSVAPAARRRPRRLRDRGHAPHPRAPVRRLASDRTLAAPV